jgi:hypothetical protein
MRANDSRVGIRLRVGGSKVGRLGVGVEVQIRVGRLRARLKLRFGLELMLE